MWPTTRTSNFIKKSFKDLWLKVVQYTAIVLGNVRSLVLITITSM